MEATVDPRSRGPDWMPITPKTGSLFHAETQKSQQSKAKRALQEIWMAETKAIAELAFDAFVESYALKYAKAADCLTQDRVRCSPSTTSRPNIGNT